VTAFPYGIASAMEYMCSSCFVANASKGQAIMEETIQRVRKEMALQIDSTIDKTKAEWKHAELYAVRACASACQRRSLTVSLRKLRSVRRK
jgi:hypothetical protein